MNIKLQEFLTYSEEELEKRFSATTVLSSADVIVSTFSRTVECFQMLEWPRPQENYVLLMQMMQVSVFPGLAAMTK